MNAQAAFLWPLGFSWWFHGPLAFFSQSIWIIRADY
jgi:hypothetical protein